MPAPSSFTQVEGWRESFEAARVRLDETRTDSLFPEILSDLCGERVRAFSLKDWTVLVASGNPFVIGGTCTIEHASNILWQLRTGALKWMKGNGRVVRVLRGEILKRCLRRFSCDEFAVVAEVSVFVDDAFLDMPGRFSKGSPTAPTQIQRFSSEVALCSEVMTAFPSFRFEELRTMPLAQFWQWLHAARKKEDPEYRNDQLTDEVNRKALGELRRLKKADQEEQQKAQTK